jgi:hypothetical protein
MASVSRRGILCRRADNLNEISISACVREAKSAESAPGRHVKPQAGNWKSESGNWKIDTANWQRYSPVSNFQSLVSSFQAIVSLNTPQNIDRIWLSPDSWTPRVWPPRLDFVENSARLWKIYYVNYGCWEKILSDTPVQKRLPLPHREGRGLNVVCNPAGRVSCRAGSCVARSFVAREALALSTLG